MFTSFIGILLAVINAKLITRTTDPPQYVTELIGIVAVVPFIGPVFSYFIVSCIVPTLSSGFRRFREIDLSLVKFSETLPRGGGTINVYVP